MDLTPEDAAFLRQLSTPAPNADAAFLQQAAGSQDPLDLPKLDVQHAHGLWDSFKAGIESSTSGLIARQEAPDIVVGPDADRAERIARMAGQVIGDLPTLIAGSVAGGAAGTAMGGPGVGTIVGAGSGAMGLTEGVRSWLMQQYDQGHNPRDLADRITATAWAAAKGAIVGGVTGGVGGKLAGVAALETLAPINQTLLRSGAELTAMVTTSKALEGQLPTAQDFIDGAIMLGGFKLAHVASAKLKTIYTRTGMTPRQVVEEAQKDPNIHVDVIDKDFEAIPDVLKGREQSPFAPVDPRLQDVAAQPRMPIPDEIKGTEHPNYGVTFKNMGEMNEGIARIADTFKPEIDAARKAGGVTWEMTRAAAESQAREWLGKDGMKSTATPEAPDWSVQMRARTAMVQSLMKDYWEKLAVAEKTPEDPLAQANVMAAVERVQMAYQSFRGASAEAGRVLNILKDSEFLPEVERMAKIQEGVDAGGGKEAVTQMIDFLKESRDLPKAARILGSKATFTEKVLEMWKAGLVSGFRTHEVNILSNLAFSMLRVPKEILADTIGQLKGQEKLDFTNTLMLTRGMAKGALDAFKMADKTIRLNIDEKGFLAGVAKSVADTEAGAKVEAGPRPAIQGKLGQVVRTPFKLLSAADAFFRTMNERAELYSLASRAALKENLKPFSPEFEARVVDIVADPTPRMAEMAKMAGNRYVFTEKVEGGIADRLQTFTHEHPMLQFVFPFIRTPAAIFREFGRMSPFAPLDEALASGLQIRGSYRQQPRCCGSADGYRHDGRYIHAGPRRPDLRRRPP